MKKLIKRLARVADSAHYSQLGSEPHSPSPRGTYGKLRWYKLGSGSVPEGYVPVYVGDEMERFVVSAKLMNHPIFVELLNRSAQEYGYEHSGGLRIPCHVITFERVLEGLRLGDDSIGDLLKELNLT